MNNNTVAREVFDGFSGLGGSACGKGSCRLENFRVREDGSLEKREGMRWLASLPKKVRGVCAVSEGGREVILCVAGDRLYRVGEEGILSDVACFASTEGEVGSFTHRGRLYFLDGVAVYRYEGSGEAKRVHGYTPLYGKNWSTYDVSERKVNEPINALSPHVRIRFSVAGSTRQVYFGFAVEAVDWVKADGVLQDTSGYSLASKRDGIDFSVLVYAEEIEVSVTLSADMYEDAVLSSCISAQVYEDFENSRVLLYGGAEGGRLFVSRVLDTEAREHDAALYEDSCGLYFPKGESLSFGYGEPITATLRLLDRVLLFFPSSTWASQPMDEVSGARILFSPICSHFGSHASRAVVMTGSASPVAVAQSGVCRLQIDPDLLEECRIERLSGEGLPDVSESFFAHAEVCYNRRRDELWFYDASGASAHILVYAPERGAWYAYGGGGVDRLFAFDGGVGCVRGGELFVFDQTLGEDLLADGAHPIEAVYESGRLDFGELWADKRLEGAVIVADLADGTLVLELSDGVPLVTERISAAVNAVSRGVYECRIPTGRFRTASLTLRLCGSARERIYRAELLAQKGKK